MKEQSKPKVGKIKKLSRFNDKRMVLAALFIVGIGSVGMYKLYQTQAAPAFPSIRQCKLFSPSLYEGVPKQGDCVETLQNFLNTVAKREGHTTNPAWPKLRIDGDFGPQTKKALIAYQFTVYVKNSRAPYPNGIVDKQTWIRIANYCTTEGIETSSMCDLR